MTTKKHDPDLARIHALGKRAAATGQRGVDDVRCEAAFDLRGKHYRKGAVLLAGAATLAELQELLREGRISWMSVR